MEKLHAQIEMAVPVKEVWQVLTDFDAYPQWNPVFTALMSSHPQAGKSFKIQIKTPQSQSITTKAVWQAFEPKKSLAWSSVWWHPLIFKAVHRFELEHIDQNRSMLIHTEIFMGLLAKKIYRDTAGDWAQSFLKLNEMLHIRVTNAHQSQL